MGGTYPRDDFEMIKAAWRPQSPSLQPAQGLVPPLLSEVGCWRRGGLASAQWALLQLPPLPQAHAQGAHPSLCSQVLFSCPLGSRKAPWFSVTHHLRPPPVAPPIHETGLRELLGLVTLPGDQKPLGKPLALVRNLIPASKEDGTHLTAHSLPSGPTLLSLDLRKKGRLRPSSSA